MTYPPSRRGSVLVSVLIIAAIGLLFGSGALLLFRYQCQLRIDRQHEFEKVYAVRSVLNYLRTFTEEIAGEREFSYHTSSDRDLKLVVKPVRWIFPDEVKNHLAIESSARGFQPVAGQYDSFRDYEHGVSGWTNLAVKGSSNSDAAKLGLCVDDLNATNSVKWWVNIGMRETGGWLQEDYGRRYCFQPCSFVDGTDVKDTVRLCIIRNVTNEANRVGERHGWPLSQKGEKALVFRVTPLNGTDGVNSKNAEMVCSEYAYEGGGVTETVLTRMTGVPSLSRMGLQLADDKVSLFYIDNKGMNSAVSENVSRGYFFSDAVAMSQATYAYFAREQTIGGKSYAGMVTNSDNRVEAPELRAVFEFEATSDKRRKTESESPGMDAAQENFLTELRVTPAYQYDVFIVHPEGVTNRATVAQKIGEYVRYGLNYSMVTYDTHGTDNKGFRKDERLWERTRQE